jgi:hypothetical protein
MVNDAIRIALSYEKRAEEEVSGRFALITPVNPRLKGYGFRSKYILSACGWRTPHTGTGRASMAHT